MMQTYSVLTSKLHICNQFCPSFEASAWQMYWLSNYDYPMMSQNYSFSMISSGGWWAAPRCPPVMFLFRRLLLLLYYVALLLQLLQYSVLPSVEASGATQLNTHHSYDGFRFILVFTLLLLNHRYSPVTVNTLVVVVVDVDFSLEPGFYQARHTPYSKEIITVMDNPTLAFILKRTQNVTPELCATTMN